MNNASVPIALLDDHTLVRKALVELINGLSGYHVVLQAANGQEFIEAMLHGPDVSIAIVDLNMPVMDGYDTIAWLTANRPAVRALALTFEANDDNVVRAMRNGARGFVLKDIEPAELRTALDHISTTGYYHTDMVHNSLMTNFDKKTSHERAQAKVLAAITPREMEFLTLVCGPDELTYEGIASTMGVHRRTVDGYREALFDKFGIKSKTGLVLFAIKWGVVKL